MFSDSWNHGNVSLYMFSYSFLERVRSWWGLVRQWIAQGGCTRSAAQGSTRSPRKPGHKVAPEFRHKAAQGSHKEFYQYYYINRITASRHIWSSYMITLCDHHIWSSYMIIIYDHHIWSSYTMIICDHHIWWYHVMSGTGTWDRDNGPGPRPRASAANR